MALAETEVPRTAASLQILMELASGLGLGARSVLAGTGLDPHDLQDADVVIGQAQEIALISNIVRLAGDRPGLGVRASKRIRIGMLGIWGFAMLSCRTTRDLVDIADRWGYGKFSWVLLPPRVHEHPLGVDIVFDQDAVPADVRNFLIERDLSFSLSLLPALFGGPAPPVAVATTMPWERASAFAAAFPAHRFTFGADRNALLIARDLLDARLPMADSQALRECELQCAQLIARRTRRTGLAESLRAALLRDPGRVSSLTEIAAARHLDPRTLRRQLALEGVTFRELVNETKEALATELLTSSAMSISQIAQRLGYSEPASFTRAYKRWTGRTPGSVAT